MVTGMMDGWALSSGPGVGEAVVAVYRPIAARCEGHFALRAACGADGLVHLSRSLTCAAVASFPPDLAAFGAASGFVDQSPGFIEFLLPRGEHKFPSTIPTHQGLV